MPSRLLAIWSSGHPVIWTSGHPVFWPSGHLIIRPSDHLVIWPYGHLVIQTSGHLIIRPFRHPTIRSSGHLVFWPFVLMPQKCPYWDIFGLSYCRLHQSQIPNVLPDCTYKDQNKVSCVHIWWMTIVLFPRSKWYSHWKFFQYLSWVKDLHWG